MLRWDPSDQLRLYLQRMHSEDIATVAAEAYEVIDGDSPCKRRK
jgi:hypothetical protein